jgi:hypothetical protein
MLVRRPDDVQEIRRLQQFLDVMRHILVVRKENSSMTSGYARSILPDGSN